MGERKMKVADVARATGLHRNTLTLLYDETATRVDLDAINRLCAFFDVSVAELFEFIPENEKKGRRRTTGI
jgi:putative transcriptional regulator